jgi:hypothetical protein
MSRSGLRVYTQDDIKRAQERYMKDKLKARKKALKPFPDTDRDERITSIRESLASAYDEAVAAQKREADMGTPAVDGARFPSAAAKGVR